MFVGVSEALAWIPVCTRSEFFYPEQGFLRDSSVVIIACSTGRGGEEDPCAANSRERVAASEQAKREREREGRGEERDEERTRRERGESNQSPRVRGLPRYSSEEL